jgi:hypothetical protein
MMTDFITMGVNQIIFWLTTKAHDYFFASGPNCKKIIEPFAVNSFLRLNYM